MTSTTDLAQSAGAGPPVDTFKAVFRQHPAGVAVVTLGGERPTGFTATSVTSLSADPPLLTFNVALTASAWPAVERTGHVAVHLLTDRQSDLATVFATSGIDRLAVAGRWHQGPHGLPLLPDVRSRLVARSERRVVVAGQAVVVAEVLDALTFAGAPLLYHDRSYTTLT